MKASNYEGNIRKRGNHSWEGSVVLNGKREYVYGKTSQEVRRLISTLVLQNDLGMLNVESDMKYSEWLEQWYSSFLSVKENTMVRYREDIDLYIKPLLGKIRLRELRTIQIQAFYNKLLQQGLSVKTVRNIHGVVHASLERAEKTDLLNKNVSNNCVLPKFRQAEMHPLQGDEVARFLEAIKGDDFENLYYVTLFTGMRQGEALGLTWDSVFFDQGCLHLHHQLQKERKKGGQYRLVELKDSQDRYVQIPLQVVAVLQRIKDAQLEKQKVSGTQWSNPLGFVFVDEKGGHLSKVTTYNHLKRIAKKMGKPELRYHDLRHSWTVIMLTVGASLKAVSTCLVMQQLLLLLIGTGTRPTLCARMLRTGCQPTFRVLQSMYKDMKYSLWKI